MIVPHFLGFCFRPFQYLLILPQPPTLQQDSSLWNSAGPFAPRGRHKYRSFYWGVSVVSVPFTYVPRGMFLNCLVVYRTGCSLGFVEHMEQSTSRVVLRVVETTDSSDNETEGSERHRRVHSNCTYKTMKVWGVDAVRHLFVTRTTQSFLQLNLQKRYVSVDTWVPRFSATLSWLETFLQGQHLRLESPGWRIIDYEGNPMTEEEVEQQRQRVLRASQVVRDREYTSAEDIIVDIFGAVDVSIPVVAELSGLVEALLLEESYELVHQLWSQFTLVFGQINVDVTSSLDEVLVNALLVPLFM